MNSQVAHKRNSTIHKYKWQQTGYTRINTDNTNRGILKY
jgi:hypothetical protein